MAADKVSQDVEEAGCMVPLTCFARGQHACIARLGLEDGDAERLREVGLREGACVCVMMNSDKCILGLDKCRVALRREVAMNLYATELLDRGLLYDNRSFAEALPNVEPHL